MKSIQIYKTKKEYKILTMYKLESCSYIASEPIFIVPIDSKDEELSEKVFKALNASREILESEEDDFWLGNTLLKKIKESSYDKFYQSSTSCYITMKDDLIRIIPQKYAGKDQGLDMQEHQSIRLKCQGINPKKVIENIKQVLSLPL